MLEITSEIVMDLQRPGAPAIVHAKQGEKYTRAVKIKLYNGGAAWTPPDAASCWVSYCKPDGTGGTYSSYEVVNGGVLQAVTISGNALIVHLAPQVLTCAGMVCCEVHMKTVSAATDDLSTFSFFIDVQASAESGITSEDYWNMASTDKIVLLNAMRRTAEIASPSKVARRLGQFLGMGLGFGIEDETDDVVARASGLMHSALGAMSGQGAGTVSAAVSGSRDGGAVAAPVSISINVHADTDDLGSKIASELQAVLDDVLAARGNIYRNGRTNYAY